MSAQNGGITAQFHGRVFPWVRVRGNSSPITVPAKILPCERFQTRKDICGEKFGEICGDVQRTRSKVLLVYYCIYYTSIREISGHGTAGTAHTGKYSAIDANWGVKRFQ